MASGVGYLVTEFVWAALLAHRFRGEEKGALSHVFRKECGMEQCNTAIDKGSAKIREPKAEMVRDVCVVVV